MFLSKYPNSIVLTDNNFRNLDLNLPLALQTQHLPHTWYLSVKMF